jgi:hypothetical protein
MLHRRRTKVKLTIKIDLYVKNRREEGDRPAIDRRVASSVHGTNALGPVEEMVEQAEGQGIEKEMWEFTETQRCVRAVLDREMDGTMDRERCGDREECYR